MLGTDLLIYSLPAALGQAYLDLGKEVGRWSPADVDAERRTCHPQAPAAQENTLEPRACQTSFSESPCLRQLSPGSKARARRAGPV